MKAAGNSDVDQTHMGAFDESPGMLYPHLKVVPERRCAEMGCKKPFELPPGDPAKFGHLAQRKRPLDILLHDPQGHDQFVIDAGERHARRAGLAIGARPLAGNGGISGYFLCNKVAGMAPDQIHRQIKG